MRKKIVYNFIYLAFASQLWCSWICVQFRVCSQRETLGLRNAVESLARSPFQQLLARCYKRLLSRKPDWSVQRCK